MPLHSQHSLIAVQHTLTHVNNKEESTAGKTKSDPSRNNQQSGLKTEPVKQARNTSSDRRRTDMQKHDLCPMSHFGMKGSN